MKDGEPEINGDGWLKLVTGFAAVGTVLLAIFSGPIFKWASQAVLILF